MTFGAPGCRGLAESLQQEPPSVGSQQDDGNIDRNGGRKPWPQPGIVQIDGGKVALVPQQDGAEDDDGEGRSGIPGQASHSKRAFAGTQSAFRA